MGISSLARIDKNVLIGDGVSIWDNSHLRENSIIGDGCVIGENVYIGSNVRIGSNTKIQNNALVYESSQIDSGVFIGPGVILTNDHTPRAVNVDGSLKSSSDWQCVGVRIEAGASIGAGAVLIAPIVVGKWSLVGAGAVVTKNVSDFALVVGNPAIQIGWVGKSGARLVQSSSDTFICPVTKAVYDLSNGALSEKFID